MKKMAHIRPEGAQQTLEVPFAAPQHMTAAFEAAHQQRFGFYPEDAVLLIDRLTAEAVGSTGETVKCLICLEIKRPRNRLRCGLRRHIARCP